MLNVVPNPPGQSLGNSRDLIKNNFGDIDTTFTVNHVQYNDGSGNGGMHNFIQLPTAIPTKDTLNPPISSPLVALYSNNGASSTVPELFFQRNNLAASMGYAFTEGLNDAPGYSRLPSGLLVKWGFLNPIPASGNNTWQVVFPTVGTGSVAIPAFSSGTVPFAVFTQQIIDGGTPTFNSNLAVNYNLTGLYALTRLSFTVSCVNPFSGGVGIYWVAIGLG
jgi:hypothetical protein